jgi:sugar lactone lactonase YvrE
MLLMEASMSLLVALLGCGATVTDDTTATVDADPVVSTVDSAPDDTGETSVAVPTGSTAETGTPSTAATGDTGEPFDFDPRGFMVSQRNQNIEGLDRYGGTFIYAVGVGADAAGLRVLSTGDLAVAQPDTGGLVLVNALTGGSTTVLSGLSFPNALAADSRGYTFITETISDGRVRQVDVYTGDQWPVVGNLQSPNGVALSPDEETLYVAETQSGIIYAVDRLTDTEWAAPRVFFTMPTGSYYTLAVDVCGNLYTIDFFQGKLYRVLADGSAAEFLVEVDPAVSWGSYSSIRFGNGFGGWERENLYVTRRAELYEVPIGIQGRAPVY